jgi:predicted ester cyclase
MATVQEKNKTAARIIPLEIIAHGRMELIDEVIAPDAVNHSPMPGGPTRGGDMARYISTTLRAAFPDLTITLLNEFAEGDYVVHYHRNRGTHKGAFMGIPPTGKLVEWTETHIARFRNGLLVEHWGVVDALGLLAQLGAVTLPGQIKEK